MERKERGKPGTDRAGVGSPHTRLWPRALDRRFRHLPASGDPRKLPESAAGNINPGGKPPGSICHVVMAMDRIVGALSSRGW